MSERFKEPVLKTGDPSDGTVGSNPTLSANFPSPSYWYAEVPKRPKGLPC